MNMRTRGLSAVLAVILVAPASHADVFSVRQQSVGPTLGVSPNSVYTHLLDFPDDGNSAPINGVQFDPAGAGAGIDDIRGNPYSLDFIGGGPNDFASGNPAVLEDFIFNGPTETLTIGGLTPGQQYDLRLYYRNFGTRPQNVEIDLGGAHPKFTGVLDQVPTGGSNAAFWSIAYEADSPEIVVSFEATLTAPLASWHQYAVSNQLIPASPSAYGLFNTGVDDRGVALSDNDPDPHYELVAAPAGVPLGPARTAQGAPIPPWVANTGNSKWLSPIDGSTVIVPGEYRYQTALDLTGIDPNSVFITGQWAVDDVAVDILVNGTSTGQAGGPFTGLAPFALAGSLGQGLVSGVNTIEFVASNGGLAANPGGLRIDDVKVHGPAPVPEGTVAIAGLFNTGVNDFGLKLADGEIDPHYVLDDGNSPAGPDAFTTEEDGFPIPPWAANSPTSRWIGPTDAGDSNGPGGNYDYVITFDMTGLVPGTAVIEGEWATDNSGVEILLNGVPTGNVQTSGFGGLDPFSVSAVEGDVFDAGLNTLTFRVNNAGLPEAIGPTGLRVAGLVAYAQAVPEPTTLLLSLLGGMAMLGMRRRSRVAGD